MSQFVSRVLVTVVGLPVVLGFIYLGGWWLFGLALFAALVALHEFYVMARALRPLVLAGYAGALATCSARSSAGRSGWSAASCSRSCSVPAVRDRGDAPDRHRDDEHDDPRARRGSRSGSGTCCSCATFPSTAGCRLRGADRRVRGRHCGVPRRPPRSAGTSSRPSLSPGKTWEGFVAGTIAAVAARSSRSTTTATSSCRSGRRSRSALAIALAGAAGDLFESALKRDLQVKDSGRLLGGHGGMLDRIDALLFASVAAFYVVIALAVGHTVRVKRVALLGATGSIGRQAIEVVERNPELELCALASGSSDLAQLAAEHGVEHTQVGGDLTELLERVASRTSC